MIVIRCTTKCECVGACPQGRGQTVRPPTCHGDIASPDATATDVNFPKPPDLHPGEGGLAHCTQAF